MQMNSVQSCTEKRTVCGHAPGYGGLLTADCHPTDIGFAKQILLTLAQAYETSWHVEFQDDRLAFWSWSLLAWSTGSTVITSVVANIAWAKVASDRRIDDLVLGLNSLDLNLYASV